MTPQRELETGEGELGAQPGPAAVRMIEVLSESVRWANLPFTALLGAVVVYWLMVAVGFLSFDSGADVHADVAGDLHADVGADLGGDVAADVGADLDAHADADATADAHAHDGAHGHGDHAAGFLSQVLHFINLGDVPAMIVVSVLALCLWLFSMIANHYFSGGSGWRALAFVAPNLVVSAILTRYLTWPLKTFFGALNREYDEHRPLVGRTCVVTTSEVTADFGQAQIATQGAPLLIHVRSSDGQPLRKGETGLVVREDKPKQIYYVVKVTADNLEK